MTMMEIFGPVLALVGWTFFVLLLIPYRRFRAGRTGQVNFGDFRLGESTRVPAHVSLPNRNYMNLLEAPILFYVVCLVYFVTAAATPLVVTLAWTYVALRVLHSLIHISYNNVVHRLAAFAASNVALLVLWLYLVIALSDAGN